VDYNELAADLLDHMRSLHTERPQKFIIESLQGEAFVLFFIAQQCCGVVPGEIGCAMHVSSARIAQTLNSMENKGWITRRIDTGDRRRILVELTPEGKNAADTHQRAVIGLAAKMLRLLGEHDAREYVRIMGRLTRAIPLIEELR